MLWSAPAAFKPKKCALFYQTDFPQVISGVIKFWGPRVPILGDPHFHMTPAGHETKDSPLLSLRAVALPELDVGFIRKVPHSGDPTRSQQLQTQEVKRQQNRTKLSTSASHLEREGCVKINPLMSKLNF